MKVAITFPWKSRLDLLLVAQGLAPSREKARALILAGRVRWATSGSTRPGESRGRGGGGRGSGRAIPTSRAAA